MVSDVNNSQIKAGGKGRAILFDDVVDGATSLLDSVSEGRRVMHAEAKCIAAAADRLSDSFNEAVVLLLECRGKVIVTGMGKSGHIASKIAATFASTGTPAFFIHPAELRHGDFGMLEERDVVLAISASGETDEIKFSLDPIRRLGCCLVAMTGCIDSTLGQVADIVLDTSVRSEACPFNLSPTSSTAVTLAMGDALAMALMAKKNFCIEDYVRSHPGGSLGRRLMTVEHVMRSEVELPVVSDSATYAEVLSQIELRNLGFAAVCDPGGKLVGIVTDGDVRRAQVRFESSVFSKLARDVMTSGPRTISSRSLAAEALKIMDKHAISDVLIVNDNAQPTGVVRLKDLLRAGIF